MYTHSPPKKAFSLESKSGTMFFFHVDHTTAAGGRAIKGAGAGPGIATIIRNFAIGATYQASQATPADLIPGRPQQGSASLDAEPFYFSILTKTTRNSKVLVHQLLGDVLCSQESIGEMPGPNGPSVLRGRSRGEVHQTTSRRETTAVTRVHGCTNCRNSRRPIRRTTSTR